MGIVGVIISVDGRRKHFDTTNDGESAEYMLEEAAATVEDLAKSNAPVKTGKLVNSIGIENSDDKSVTVGTDLEYAVYQENGTNRIPGVRFFEDAVNQVKGEYSGYLKFSYLRGY
jgi:HK97 gp10 family phage protein